MSNIFTTNPLILNLYGIKLYIYELEVVYHYSKEHYTDFYYPPQQSSTNLLFKTFIKKEDFDTFKKMIIIGTPLSFEIPHLQAIMKDGIIQSIKIIKESTNPEYLQLSMKMYVSVDYKPLDYCSSCKQYGIEAEIHQINDLYYSLCKICGSFVYEYE